MSRSRWQLGALAAVLMAGWITVAAPAQSGAAFTYQGQLKQLGDPVTEFCDFEFSLWDDEFGGEQVGTTQYIPDVEVQDGLFTVLLNADGEFGVNAFDGQPRWLEITVTVPPDDPLTLSPRQPVTPTPYALYALDCAGGASGDYWALTGNSGTTAGVDFLGTTDDVTLELRVNSVTALRIEPDPTSPNLIGGRDGNYATEGVRGATIAGGGTSLYPNHVTAHYGTIAGGWNNEASGLQATVGGGHSNTAGALNATVGGGWANTASGTYSAVAGGSENQAGSDDPNAPDAAYATVSGGGNNKASGTQATVGGGYNNEASGANATVAGGYQNVSSDVYATVGGGLGNQAGDNDGVPANKPYATVAGGWVNTASNFAATVGGGNSNTASGNYAVVAGGHGNTASGVRSMIPGGLSNTAGGDYSFAAGRRAKANHEGAFVWADSSDPDSFFESTANDQFLIRAAGGVGVGTSTPAAHLHVGPSDHPTGLKSEHVGQDGGAAIHGEQTYASDYPTYGGLFQTAGKLGVGVLGTATNDTTTQLTYGGYFQAAGPMGTGVYGEAPALGVGGLSPSTGVRGYASNNGAVVNYGGSFHAAGEEGRGVYGEATHTGGETYGGYFEAMSSFGTGVYGEASDDYGVGVHGVGASIGVSGEVYPTGSSHYYGVYGLASGGSGTNTAVNGLAMGEGTNYAVWGYALGGTENYAGYFVGDVHVDADLQVNNDLHVDGTTTTQVLAITGGGDLSERFDISSPEGDVTPGMVVCIDPGSPGHLVVSSKAYDRTAAGIVSGAGGVKPGMLMGQEGSRADGAQPVALSGRVYCWVDASNGPIVPGDLLTTSDTPGHAMKVTDHSKAQGAIIGKAMTSLDSGKELVLVLVSLQ